MVWLVPAALLGLAAVLGPLIVHLLRRQRARPLVVPTTRFVPAVSQSLVRARLPADVALLLVRMAIIASAALALARPLFLTDARAAGWADRIARVVVVDVSDPATTGAATDAVAAELQSAAFSHRIDVQDVRTGVQRAAAWLAAAPPARREIVVMSSFEHGTFDESVASGIPEAIGLRVVALRSPVGSAAAEMSAGPVLAVDNTFERQVRIDATSTSVIFAPGPVAMDGLRLLAAPEDAKEAAALLRIVSRAGALAPASGQPIVIRFPGGGPLPPAASPGDGSAFDAALRLLQKADAAHWPVTATSGQDGALLVDVNAPPGTLLAAEVLKAALDARQDPQLLARQEVALVPSTRLDALNRPPGPAEKTAWRQSDESDGRWFWLAALLLLGVESWMRRSRPSPARAHRVDAHAA